MCDVYVYVLRLLILLHGSSMTLEPFGKNVIGKRDWRDSYDSLPR